MNSVLRGTRREDGEEEREEEEETGPGEKAV